MCLLSLSAGAVAAPAASASDGSATAASEADAAPTTIDSCTRITEPGVYVLGENVTNASATEDTGIEVFENETVRACILVASSDVVVRGGGHVVDGEGFGNVSDDETLASGFNETERAQYALGVAVLAANVTAANGTAANGTAANGTAASNVTVANLTLSDWFVGAYVENASRTTLRDVDASGNANLGMEFVGTTDALVASSSADRNGFAGLYATRTRNLTVSGSSFDGNAVLGVDLFFANDAPLLVNVTASNASVAGIAVVQSSDAVVAESAVADSGGDDSLVGVSASYLFANASDAVVVDSRSVRGGSWAVYASECAHAGGACAVAGADEGASAGAATVSAFRVGDANVSFSGENVAVGSAAAVAGEPTAAGSVGLGDGLVLANVSPEAYVDLSTRWGSGPTLQVTDAQFSAGNATGGTQTDEADVAIRGNRVVVSGTTWGADACDTAELAAASYDDERGVLTVVVNATRDVSSDAACAQVISELPYRAVVTLTGTPDAVEVVHVHDGERTVVATAGNESAGNETTVGAGSVRATVAAGGR